MDTVTLSGLTLAGGVAGALLAGGAGWLRRRGRLCPDVDARQLSEAEERSIAGQFALHSRRVHEQLREYADALADGDPELRERLRRLEEAR
jgi:hypothetical protein